MDYYPTPPGSVALADGFYTTGVLEEDPPGSGYYPYDAAAGRPVWARVPSEQSPPRVQLDLGFGAGAVFGESTLWRSDSTGRSRVRTQPAAGSDSARILDYEAPFEESLTYIWEGSYTQDGVTTTFSEESFPVTLRPASGWLIHPGKPSLSFELDHDVFDPYGPAIATISTLTRQPRVTVNYPLGGTVGIPVITGGRGKAEFSVVIETETPEQRLSLVGLLADLTPILFRTLPSWGMEFEDGFYQVMNFTEERIWEGSGNPERRFGLELLPVASPAVIVQEATYTWAQLAADYPTWADVEQSFATWANVEAGA